MTHNNSVDPPCALRSSSGEANSAISPAHKTPPRWQLSGWPSDATGEATARRGLSSAGRPRCSGVVEGLVVLRYIRIPVADVTTNCIRPECDGGTVEMPMSTDCSSGALAFSFAATAISFFRLRNASDLQ